MTPSEWLLEQFDTGAARPTNHVRAMAEVLDDHRGPCSQDCLRWAGQASWPTPRLANDITMPSSIDSPDYRVVNMTARLDLEAA